MREIKFRYTCEDMSGEMFQIFKELTDFLNGGMNMHSRIQKIVAVDQYTGLKDRNGVEIYEGGCGRLRLRHRHGSSMGSKVCLLWFKKRRMDVYPFLWRGDNRLRTMHRN